VHKIGCDLGAKVFVSECISGNYGYRFTKCGLNMKKTQKTPKKEIEKAMRLKQEYFETKNKKP
jgi:hypothetical protein